MRIVQSVINYVLVISVLVMPQSAFAEVPQVTSKVKTIISPADVLTAKRRAELTLSVQKEYEKNRTEFLESRQFHLSTPAPSINPFFAGGMSFIAPFFTEVYFAENASASLRYNVGFSAFTGILSGIALDVGIPIALAIIGSDWRLIPTTFPYVVSIVHPVSALLGFISADGHNRQEATNRLNLIAEATDGVKNNDTAMEEIAIKKAISDAETNERQRLDAERKRKDRERREAEQRRLEAQRLARQKKEEAKARAEQARIDAYNRNHYTQIIITGTSGTRFSGAIPGDSQYSTVSVSGVVPETYTIYTTGYVGAVIQNQDEDGYIEVTIVRRGREVAREASYTSYGVVSVSTP